MKIPFIQHKGVGIHITRHAIRWVELSRIRERLKITRSEIQTVESAGIKKALHALVDRIQPRFPFVTVNLDSSGVEENIEDIPFMDDEQYMKEWLSERKMEQHPPDADHEAFKVTHHLFGDPDVGQHCLFIRVKTEAIQERISLLEEAGLHPVCLTTGTLETGYTAMFEQNFTTGSSWLLNTFEDGPSVHKYENGLLQQIHFLSPGREMPRELLAEAETLIASESIHASEEQQPLFWTSSQFIDNIKDSTYHSSKNQPIIPLHPLSHLEYEGNTLSPDAAIACAMALKQLYTSLDNINLLDEEVAKPNKEGVIKRDALSISVGLGVMVGIFFMLMLMAQWILESKIKEADAKVARLEDKITAVSDAKNRIKQLKNNVIKSKQLVSERASTAPFLEAIGRALPNGVWLKKLVINVPEEDGATSLILSGLAWNDALIAVLLEALEKNKKSRDVRLLYSEQVETNNIYDGGQFQKEQLVRFEINVGMKIKEKNS